MVVTQENIGNILCRYDTGERFVIHDVTEDGLSVQYENGLYNHLVSNVVFGAIEQDEARIASFQNNLSLSRVLASAKAAADRRFTSGQYDVIERENAAHVANIVNEQNNYLQSRIQDERRTLKAGFSLANQFLSELAEQGTGATAHFFDTLVQCRGGPTHLLFCMNQSVILDRQAAANYLSTRTIDATMTSLDSRIKSAINRAEQQHHDSHTTCVEKFR